MEEIKQYIEMGLETRKEVIRSKSALTIQGYQISKDILTNDEQQYFRKQLTQSPIVAKSVQNLVKPVPVSAYNETMKYVYLPKSYGLQYFGIPLKKRILYKEQEIQLEFTKTLRAIQDEAQSAFLKLVQINKKNGSGCQGLISLPTGYGKTVLGVSLITQLKVKTIIIAHKDFLLEQWQDALQNFTNIKIDDIGIVKGKKCEVQNKKVILSSLQSISMKDYPPKLFLDIGFAIFDEFHHLNSEVFSKALPKLSVKYMLGLSATPNRDDGLEKIGELYIGKSIFSLEMEKDNNIQINVYVYRPPKERNEDYYKRIMITDNNFNMSKMLNNLTNFEPRNLQIISILEDLLKKEPERKVLFLSERKSQLQYCYKIMIEKKYNCGLYYSGIPKKQLTESLQSQILFATMQMVSEGFDQPSLNTLVLSSPKVKIVQIIGRILRTPKNQRKVKPLVIDIFDTVQPFSFYNNSRKNYYLQKGYTIIPNEEIGLKIQIEDEKTINYNPFHEDNDQNNDDYLLLQKLKKSL